MMMVMMMMMVDVDQSLVFAAVLESSLSSCVVCQSVIVCWLVDD